MKKRTLLVCSVCLLSTMISFAQESNQANHTPSKTVLSVPVLNEQAENIRLKEQQLGQAATSSRGVYTSLKQELNDLNKQYAALLSQEIAMTSNQVIRRELEAELTYVEQQLALAAATNQR